MEPPSIPTIIPCMNGVELSIEPELVDSCLSALSLKVLKSSSAAAATDQTVPTIQHRNSFGNLHRPEMTRINTAPISPRKVALFLHKHATTHGPFCADLHSSYNPEEPGETDQIRCLLAPREARYSDDGVMLEVTKGEGGENVSTQMTDEDLRPGEVVRKSRALFCVLMRNFNTQPQETNDTLNEATDRVDNFMSIGEHNTKSSPETVVKTSIVGRSEQLVNPTYSEPKPAARCQM